MSRNFCFELTFPRDLDLNMAAEMFTALAGLFPPERKPGTPASVPTAAFEVLATAGGIHHLLTVPIHLAQTVRAHLRTAVPAIGLAEVELPPRGWLRAVELDRHGFLSEADHAGLAVTLLGSLTDLTGGEAVLLQAVLTPLGERLGYEDEALFAGVLRLAVAGEATSADARLRRVMAAYRGLGARVARALPPRWLGRVSDQAPPLLFWPLHLSAATLALVCALPMNGPEVPGLVLGRGRRFQADPEVPTTGSPIAHGNFLGAERPLAITGDDRLKHLYLLAPTGAGKSTLMLGQLTTDIEAGHGVVLVEPGSEMVKSVLARIPPERADDVVVYDLTETERPVGFNILAGDPYAVMGQVTTVLDQLFALSANAPRAIDALRSALLTVALAGLTLCEVPVVLAPGPGGKALRDKVARGLDNSALADYWSWFEGLKPGEQAEVAAPIARRLRPFLLYPSLRASLGQVGSGFDMAELLANGKILLVPLSRGQLGDELAFMTGALVLARLWSAIQARPTGSRDFFVYLDEFQDLIKLPIGLGEMFAQARSRHVGFVVAHHHLGQLSPTLRRDVLGNVRSKVVFRLGVEDARVMAAEFGEGVRAEDIQALGAYEVMVQLLAANRVTRPATGMTYPAPPPISSAAEIRERSRQRYGRAMAEIEAELAERHQAHVPQRTPSGRPSVDPPAVGWEDWPE
jgi:hypothetical protein